MKYYSGLLGTAAITLVLVSVFGFGAFEVVRATDAVRVAKAAIVTEEARGFAAEVNKEFLDRTERQRADVATYFIGVDGTADALSLVEQLARASQVQAKVTAATIGNAGAVHHEELSVTLSVRGTFTNVLSLATMLESLPRVSSVRTVTLDAVPGGEWQGTIVVSFIKVKAQ